MARVAGKPVIGITADREDGGGYSALPWYALRQNYCDAVVAAGGLPLMLPHGAEDAGSYLELIDGLLVSGGAFDVDPALFGATERHDTVALKPGRTDFEMAVTKGAWERDMPILGICGGQQLLAVALGCPLIQHIPDAIPDALAHEQPNPRTEPGHTVETAADSLLRLITEPVVGGAVFPVNSAHHQAVAAGSDGAVVNALAPDGVIEGIEDPSRRFCLGVQWHPEYAISPADGAILDAFVAASR